MPVNVGDVIETRCGTCKVVKYIPACASKKRMTSVVVRFTRPPYYTCTVDLTAIRRGSIRDPYYPTVYGVGYLGEGPHLSTDQHQSRRKSRTYAMWQNMLERCYDKVKQLKSPTYAGCSVVRRWHNFQNFADDIQAMPNWDKHGFELDKDLLCLGNKVYGPKTCCFVPAHLNTAILKLDAVGINFATRKSNSSPYSVYMKRDGRQISLGSFPSEIAATIAYKQARAKYMQELASRYADVIPDKARRSVLAISKQLKQEARGLAHGKALRN